MPEDIVPLGFDVDTSALAKAKGDASDAATSLGKVADQLDAISEASDKATGSTTKVVNAAKDATNALNEQANATKGATAAETSHTDALNQGTSASTAAATGKKKVKDAAQDAAAAVDAEKTATIGLNVAQQQQTSTGGSLTQQLNSIQQHAKDLADQQGKLGTATKQASNANADHATSSASVTGALSRLQSGAVGVQGAVSKVAEVSENLTHALGVGGEGGGSSLTGALGLAQRGLSAVGSMLGGVSAMAIGAVGAVVGIAAAFVKMQSSLAGPQDEMRLLSGRVRVAVGDQNIASDAMQQIIKSADAAGIAIEAYADTFTRFERIRTEMGLSTQGVLDFTDAITKLGKISGATPYQIQMGLMQLSQGLGTGRLQGQDLKFMLEDVPAIGTYLAKGLGVNSGRLREMGTNGELTPAKFVNALQSQYGQIDQDVGNLPNTSEQAFTRMKNDATAFKAALGEVTGATQFVQAGIDDISLAFRNLTTMIKGDAPQSAQQIEQLISRIQTQLKADPGAGAVTIELQAQLKAAQDQLKQVQAKSDAYGGEGNSRAVGIVTNAKNVLTETDEYTKKTKTLKEQMDSTASAIYELNLKSNGFDAKQKAQDVAYLTDQFARLKLELQNAGTAYDKLTLSTQHTADDMATYGPGSGGVAFGGQVRKIEEDQTAKGLPPLPTDAVNKALMDSAAQTWTNQRADMASEAERQRRLLGTVGQSPLARARVESQNEAEASVTSQIGPVQAATPEGRAQIQALTDSNYAVKSIAASLQTAQAVFNARGQLASAQAGASAVNQGAYAVRQAETRTRARYADSQAPGTGALEIQQFNASEAAAADTQIRTLMLANQKLRDQIESSGSPNSLKAIDTAASVRTATENVAPDKRQSVSDAMYQQADLENQKALADQTAELKQQLDYVTQQRTIASLTGEEYAVQEAVLEKKHELELAGVTASNDQYQQQISITAELAKQQYALENQKTVASDVNKAYSDAVQGIGSGFANMFERIATTGNFRLRAMLNDVGNMAAKISTQIIEDLVTKPLEAAAKQYGPQLLSGLGNLVAGLFGGSAGSTSTLGLGTSMGMDTIGAGSSSVGSNSYGFTMNAMGGAYNSPSLSQYSSSILSSPTFFKFANGGSIGVAGEAGPEGILPLQRQANGKLGVAASGVGGGGGDTYVQVFDQRSSATSAPVETQQSRGSDGKKQIAILVKDAVTAQMNGGEYDTTLRANFGTQRTITRR